MKALTLARSVLLSTVLLASGLLGSGARADERISEPDLVFHGSVSIEGVLIENADPVPGNNAAVAARIGTTVIATYRLGDDADYVSDAGIVQFLVRVPMEFLVNGAAPSGDTAVLDDVIEFIVTPPGSAPVVADSFVVTERGAVVQLDLDASADGCTGDFDGSGDIGFSDLLAILAAWGPCSGCPTDLDMDGITGFSDLLSVLALWGPCE